VIEQERHEFTHKEINMEPLKVGAPRQFVRLTQKLGRKKERMERPKIFVELEDVTTSETKSISPTRIEE
jgi:hypothetical protein